MTAPAGRAVRYPAPMTTYDNPAGGNGWSHHAEPWPDVARTWIEQTAAPVPAAVPGTVNVIDPKQAGRPHRPR